MSMTLRELLEAAVDLEEKAAAALVETPLADTGFGDPAPEDGGNAELIERIRDLESQVEAMRDDLDSAAIAAATGGEGQLAAADLGAALDADVKAMPGAADQVTADPAHGMVAPDDKGIVGRHKPCPSCGGKDADEYADGTATCQQCGTLLEKKALEGGFDFVDDPSVELEEKAVMHQPPGSAKGGQFAPASGASQGQPPPAHMEAAGNHADDPPHDPSGKEMSKDPKDYEKLIKTPDDVRALLANWARVPVAIRGAVKAAIQAQMKTFTEPGAEHERLNALVDGLGHGSGKALAGGTDDANHWLRHHGHPDAGREGGVGVIAGKSLLSEAELLRGRRLALEV